MNLQLIATTKNSNQQNIQRLQTSLSDVAPRVPNLVTYTNDDFISYLVQQGYTPKMSNWTTLLNQLTNNYQTKKSILVNIDYYNTLTNICNNLITFYQAYFRSPSQTELATLAMGTGISSNIQKSISYIQNSGILN